MPHLRDARRQVASLGPDAIIDIIADFLGHIWKHSLHEIETNMHLKVLPLKVALAVPAMWPTYALPQMLEAAKRAGILEAREIGETTLSLVQEPETQVLATLYRSQFPGLEVRLLP